MPYQLDMLIVSIRHGIERKEKYMNRSDYRKIARKHGVSIREVKADMQEAIDAAYVNPTFHAQCVYRKGEKPTIDEFVNHIARRIKAGYDG